MEFPQAFVENVRQEGGEQWLASLPAQLEYWCSRWDLTVVGAPRHGYLGLVFPVTCPQGPAVLKLTRVDEETREEAAALRVWEGRGAVRLLESAEGVLLLERLEAERSLAHQEIGRAVSEASRLLRVLSVPVSGGFLEMGPYAEGLLKLARQRWQRFHPFPEEWLKVPEVREGLLVNQDLHYENVLARGPDWLVIDPKPLRGDPEFAVAPLLWNRFDGDLGRLDQIVTEAGLDWERTRQWTLFRVLEYWLWALNLGFSEDPERCRALAERLAQPTQP
jgi:streptomycin 6-kinase